MTHGSPVTDRSLYDCDNNNHILMSVLPSSDISDVGYSSRSGGRQEDSQVCPIDTGIFVHGDCGRNHGSHQQRRYCIPGRPRKAHHSSYWWQPRQSLPLPTFLPTQPLRTSSSHSSLSFFTFVFNLLDLYYLDSSVTARWTTSYMEGR